MLSHLGKQTKNKYKYNQTIELVLRYIAECTKTLSKEAWYYDTKLQTISQL